MGISNGRDKLSRVAFQTNDGAFFKFRLNPTNMKETYAARNTFTQAENTIFMQGFGQGLHTISITGTTGVNHGAGVDLIKQLKEIIVDQINNAHDSANGTFVSNFVTLKFHNFTNGESWLVEMDQQGISIEQDVSNPLSYTYSINMVVVGPTDTPSTSEITWVQLGTKHPSLTPTKIPVNATYIYGRKLDKLDADGYTSTADQFKASKYETINNYGQKGMYEQKKLLSIDQVKTLYKVVYGDTVDPLDIDRYVESSKQFGGAGIKNYGSANSATANAISKMLPVEDLETVYQQLYGSTLDSVDYNVYSRLGALYDTMKKGSIIDYGTNGSADTNDDSLSIPDATKMFSAIYGKTVKATNFNQYTASGVSFSQGKKESINDYGQGNADDAMFKSYQSYQDMAKYSYPDYINPWEANNKSIQTEYTNGDGYYVHPLVSQESMKYSYNALDNVLRI